MGSWVGYILDVDLPRPHLRTRLLAKRLFRHPMDSIAWTLLASRQVIGHRRTFCQGIIARFVLECVHVPDLGVPAEILRPVPAGTVPGAASDLADVWVRGGDLAGFAPLANVFQKRASLVLLQKF